MLLRLPAVTSKVDIHDLSRSLFFLLLAQTPLRVCRLSIFRCGCFLNPVTFMPSSTRPGKLRFRRKSLIKSVSYFREYISILRLAIGCH